MKEYDFVISINVHEKVDFLMKQLDNIKEFVESSYCVVVNCNDYIYNELKNKQLPENIYINTEIINKMRFHGSLFKGIYSNMVYALSNITFTYFLILSSRSQIYRKINKNLNFYSLKLDKSADNNNWANWWSIKQTKLSKYYNNVNLFICAHEGLLLTYTGCKSIDTFLDTNTDIREYLFNFNSCIEEFALQTITGNNKEYVYDLLSADCNKQNGTSIAIYDDIHFITKINR